MNCSACPYGPATTAYNKCEVRIEGCLICHAMVCQCRSEPTRQDIRAARNQLATEIAELVDRFEIYSDLKVSTIDVEHRFEIGFGERSVMINVEATL